jgi:hypothetical protein
VRQLLLGMKLLGSLFSTIGFDVRAAGFLDWGFAVGNRSYGDLDFRGWGANGDTVSIAVGNSYGLWLWLAVTPESLYLLRLGVWRVCRWYILGSRQYLSGERIEHQVNH